MKSKVTTKIPASMAICAAIFSACIFPAARVSAEDSSHATGRLGYEMTIVDRMLSQNPNDGAALAKKGRLLLDMDEPEKAIEVLNKAVKFAPEMQRAQAYETLGKSYYLCGKRKEARSAYESALRFKSDKYLHAGLYFGIASTYEDEGENEKALEAISQALKTHQDGYLFEARAGLLRKLKRYKEAAADLTSAIKICPLSSPSYAKRAQVYDILGEKDLAQKDRLKVESLAKEAM